MKNNQKEISTTTTNTESRYLTRRSFLRKSSVALGALVFGASFGTNHLLSQTALAQPGSVATNTVSANQALTGLNGAFELDINFEVKSPSSGRGERPYVAVWVEDWTGESVRTLHLWMQRNNGEKYLPDLKRWHRNDRKRRSSRGKDIIRTVSSPTRRPGTYNVVWDGKNDSGEALKAGEYYICVEYARENGPYHLVRGRVNLGTSTFTESFKGDAELGDVQIDYRSI